MMNGKGTGVKRSKVNDELNTYSKILFVIMLALSIGIVYLKGVYVNMAV